ncbi:hypothetical protein EJ110_NYTH02287 [Nymphaea thermarum]|nr:hypothetical protein EJ110_NYTH02287 [Nymphaea thermarum]
MAYRRRHSAKSYPTFADDPPSSPTGEDGSSLAAAAIRASALRRGLSLSSAHGGSVLSSSYRDWPEHRAPEMQQASAAYEYTSLRDFRESKSSGFWGVLAMKAKTIFDEENGTQKIEALVRGGPQTSEASTGIQFHQSHQSTEIPPKMENPTVQKGLNAVTTSLNYIGGTIGNALGEGFTVMEAKAADIISDTRKLHIRRKGNAYDAQRQHSTDPDVKGLRLPAINVTSTQGDFETQLKASRDVASAMAAKAKLLLRELKSAKADLAFAKERCVQLEEENRVLREATEKGESPEDDDLIRYQLETLLAEKARLANENSIHARENRFLREIVEYHQLQDVVDLEEEIEEETDVSPISFESELETALSPARQPSSASPSAPPPRTASASPAASSPCAPSSPRTPSPPAHSAPPSLDFSSSPPAPA